MEMFLLLIPVILLLVLAYKVSRQSKVIHNARSIVIQASPEKIFRHVSDLQRFDVWNTFLKADPKMQSVISDPSAGVGATHYWKGNSQAGEGRMTILEIVPSSQIRIRVEFVKPFPGIQISEFSFISVESGGTTVTWTMSGPQALISRIVSVFVDMNALMTKELEASLLNLKRLVETEDVASV